MNLDDLSYLWDSSSEYFLSYFEGEYSIMVIEDDMLHELLIEDEAERQAAIKKMIEEDRPIWDSERMNAYIHSKWSIDLPDEYK